MKSIKGFTLVEFMVAIAISLVLLTGILQLYLNVSRTNAEMARTNLQIENGRFALQILEEDLQHAGYWGGYVPDFDNRSVAAVPADLPAGIPDPCAAYPGAWNAAYKTALVGLPVQVYDGANLPCPAILLNIQPNTDVLIVRHAETCIPGVGNCDPDKAGMLYMQASECISGPAPDPVFYKLEATNFDLRKRSCTAGDVTAKRKLVSHMYYVRDYSVTLGDGIPTLMRSQLDFVGGTVAFQPGVPLIEGIEAFRVELGIDNVSKVNAPVDYALAGEDNRGDSVPDPQPGVPAPFTNQAFIRCVTMPVAPWPTCTVDQLVNTVAVKLFVLVRNTQATLGYVDTKTYNLSSLMPAAPALTVTPNDSFQRHLYTSMVRLNNVSMRRETPP